MRAVAPSARSVDPAHTPAGPPLQLFFDIDSDQTYLDELQVPPADHRQLHNYRHKSRFRTVLPSGQLSTDHILLYERQDESPDEDGDGLEPLAVQRPPYFRPSASLTRKTVARLLPLAAGSTKTTGAQQYP